MNNASDPKLRLHNPEPQRQISSRTLLDGAKEILIQHADQVYRLRETRSGKLIMHK